MTLETNLQDLATRMGTEAKALRTLINGNQADLSGLTTTTKTSLVAALNELKTAINSASGIDDSSISSGSSWSSQRTTDAINAAIAGIINGAPTAFDTLKELADAFASDQTALAGILQALDKRVSVSTAQGFTAEEKAQGRSNIDAVSTAAIGDPDRDLVAVFNAALV